MTSTRDAIVRLLARADRAMTADAVAVAAGVHVTTARFHLDRLVADGAAVRETLPPEGRGRPRVAYAPAAAARADPARRAMVSALANALAATKEGPALARAAGSDWAEDLDGDLPAILTGLGFAPETVDGGLLLRACPFADAARAHPGIVCEAHRGLVGRVASRDGRIAQLHPFSSPGACLVTMGEASPSR